MREDIRTTVENAAAKRANGTMNRKTGRISDNVAVPNLGSFLSSIDLWYYTTSGESSRTLHHLGPIGETNQDELIAENMVRPLMLSHDICLT